MSASVDKIDALLPQTQCTKCGYKDCMDYAKAIYHGEKHNRCPPGGEKGIRALSDLLKRDMLQLDENCGRHEAKQLAVIDEALCIGCTKCIDACPVDAIIGSKKQMHSVISNDCTGCALCVEPCPMDCIDMRVLPPSKQPENLALEVYERQKASYREKHVARDQRLAEKAKIAQQKHRSHLTFTDGSINRKAYIEQALAAYKKKKRGDG